MMRAVRSPIWQYFSISSDNNKYAVCSLCGVKISRGGEGKKAGTTAMSNHLKTKHPEKFKAIMKDKAEKAKVSTPPPDSITETFSTNYTKSNLALPDSVTRKIWKENDAKARKYHYLIAEMIALDNEPFSVLEQIGFRRLLEHALPRYIIPSRSYLEHTIIPDIQVKIYEKIKRYIEYAIAISITSDIWDSSHSKFLTLTCHWLSPEFQMQHGVLAVKNIVNYQPDVTAKELNITTTCWDIAEHKIHLLIYNNEADLTKDLVEYDSGRCFIEYLERVITESIKTQPEIVELIVNCRNLVSHSNVDKKLLAIQKELHLPEQQLVQDITTRWNSTFYMVERILKHKRAISLYMAVHDTLANFTLRQWCLMEQFIKLLKPFEEITKITSSSISCISEVIPHVARLNKYLHDNETAHKSPDLQDIRVSLKTEIENIYTSIKKDLNYLVSTFLDPRFKTKYMEITEVERVQMKILMENVKLSGDKTLEDNLATSAPVKRNRQDSTPPNVTSEDQELSWDCFNEVSGQDQEMKAISSEIDYYLNTIRIDCDSDPYVWWSSNMKQYPILSKFARIYLSAPCSSVNREKLFSEPGLYYEDRRNQLCLNEDKLVFIHHNLPLVDFEY